MHIARAVYEHRWTAPAALVLGVIALTVGIVADGLTEGDLRSLGVVVVLAAYVERRDRSQILQGCAEAHRIGYRIGRHARSAELALVRPEDDDAMMPRKRQVR